MKKDPKFILRKLRSTDKKSSVVQRFFAERFPWKKCCKDEAFVWFCSADKETLPIPVEDLQNGKVFEKGTFFEVTGRTYSVEWPIELGNDANESTWNFRVKGTLSVVSPEKVMKKYGKELSESGDFISVDRVQESLFSTIADSIRDLVVSENNKFFNEINLQDWVNQHRLNTAFFRDEFVAENAPIGKAFLNAGFCFKVESARFESPNLASKITHGTSSEAFSALAESHNLFQISGFSEMVEECVEQNYGLKILALALDKFQVSRDVKLEKTFRCLERRLAPVYKMANAETPPKKEDFSLQLPYLRQGDSLAFTVNAARSGFLTILNIDEEGFICPLLPSPLFPKERISSGETLPIGTSESKYITELTEAGCHGTDSLVVFITERPLFENVPQLMNGALTAEEAMKLIQKINSLPADSWTAHALVFTLLPSEA